jgi:hypothetical protein
MQVTAVSWECKICVKRGFGVRKMGRSEKEMGEIPRLVGFPPFE